MLITICITWTEVVLERENAMIVGQYSHKWTCEIKFAKQNDRTFRQLRQIYASEINIGTFTNATIGGNSTPSRHPFVPTRMRDPGRTLPQKRDHRRRLHHLPAAL